MPTHTLPDGRRLTYDVYGDPGGVPVLFSHGLCDSGKLRHWDQELTNSLGVRILAVDQPGVAGSSPGPLRERTLRQYAEDIEHLADAVQWTTFAVAGHSGGGPHALALAKYLPDRVTHGVLAAPAPPMNQDEFLAGFPFPMWIVKLVLTVCRWLPWLIHGACYVLAWWANRNIPKFVEAVAVSDRTSGNPETFLGHPKQTAVFEDNFRAGLAQGAAGTRGMFQIAFLNPSWGFELEDVRQSMHVFVCDQDPIIPPIMGQKLAQALPKGTCRTWSNAGHYSFVDRECWIEMLKAVTKERQGN